MKQTNGSRPLVDIQHVVKEFTVTRGAFLPHRVGTVKAVSDVSLAIQQGETFGLVGESGCGKTTLGRLVVALEKPDSGQIWFDGDDLAKLGRTSLRSKRRGMQLMFQDPYSSLDPRMRVGDILAEPLVIHRIGSKRERGERVDELLREVGLSPTAVERYPHEFSGGQRQRIGLARALALVEPVVDAEPARRAQIIVAVERQLIVPREPLPDDEEQDPEQREVEDRHDLLPADIRQEGHEDRADHALRRSAIGEDHQSLQDPLPTRAGDLRRGRASTAKV